MERIKMPAPKREKLDFSTARFVFRMMNAEKPVDAAAYGEALNTYIADSGKDRTRTCESIEKTMRKLRAMHVARLAQMAPLAAVEVGVPGGSIVYPLRMYTQYRTRGKVPTIRGETFLQKFWDLAERYSPSGTTKYHLAQAIRMQQMIGLHRRAIGNGEEVGAVEEPVLA